MRTNVAVGLAIVCVSSLIACGSGTSIVTTSDGDAATEATHDRDDASTGDASSKTNDAGTSAAPFDAGTYSMACAVDADCALVPVFDCCGACAIEPIAKSDQTRYLLALQQYKMSTTCTQGDHACPPTVCKQPKLVCTGGTCTATN